MADQYIYLVFLFVLITAIMLDLGLLSKPSAVVSIKKALLQTLAWVSLALLFFGFLWWIKGSATALQYISAYLMEWSLSIDNIFVFLLIFSFFNIRSDHVARALIYGILMAVLLRIFFITAGFLLIRQFSWLLYLFGAFLAYTGVKIFTVDGHEKFNPGSSLIYKYLNRVLPLIHQDIGGKMVYDKDGKRYYTDMFVVIIILATTDLVFALDSIPAVFALSKDKMVIYTSNILAVLGLRSLFFLLKGAIDRFKFLHQGIAIVLIFIGLKMLAEGVGIFIPLTISLLIIIVCICGSIISSIQFARRKNKG
ncbi:MAG: TerC family protein [Flavisolibacter sp.]